MTDNNNLEKLNEAAQRAANAARGKSKEERRSDAAERARARITVLRSITEGENATRQDLELQRYRG